MMELTKIACVAFGLLCPPQAEPTFATLDAWKLDPTVGYATAADYTAMPMQITLAEPQQEWERCQTTTAVSSSSTGSSITYVFNVAKSAPNLYYSVATAGTGGPGHMSIPDEPTFARFGPYSVLDRSSVLPRGTSGRRLSR